MTFVPQKNHPSTIGRKPSNGFTVTELLVVMAIIAALAGLLLPMLVKSIRAANRTRAAQDLNTIGAALEAYKQQFGDYPRVDVPGTGFAVLGKALGAPFGDGVNVDSAGLSTRDATDPSSFDSSKPYQAGDCVWSSNLYYVAKTKTTNATPTSTSPFLNDDWGQYNCLDGADGPGFRIRPGGTVHAPFFEAGVLKFRGLAILDHYGNPILYFPQNTVKVNLALTNGTNATNGFIVHQSSNPSVPMYDFDQNCTLLRAMTIDGAIDAPQFNKSLARMRVMLGDVNDVNGTGISDGLISGTKGEHVKFDGGFILWSAGQDGLFGPFDDMTNTNLSPADRRKAVSKCDDIMNFDFRSE